MLIPELWTSDLAISVRSGNFLQHVLPYLKCSDNFHEGCPSVIWRSNIRHDLETKTESDREEHLICVGVSALCLFIQMEWTGPAASSNDQKFITDITSQWPAECVVKNLLVDCDEFTLCACPHLLLLALAIFEEAAEHFPQSKLCQLWLLRALFTQQLMLEESSISLYSRIEKLLGSLDIAIDTSQERIYFNLESARIQLYYGFVEKAYSAIEKCAQDAQLKYEFSGALGKRTHFQQNDLAQLVMNIEVGCEVTSSIPDDCADIPKSVPLTDDVRLEEIKFANPTDNKDILLNSQHVAILLAVLMLRKKSLPDDELTAEESLTMVSKILKNKGAWPVQISALLLRSHLERSSRRTVERAMMQVQSVLDHLLSDTPNVIERLDDFFFSYLPSKRGVESTLAEFQLSLGAIKSALEICLRLQNWELAIECYNILQLRHKAKELIEQELAKKETPKLWCLLGDSTDDPDCYQKAWELSNERSARAQRHWANFCYMRKKYGDSIEHFEKSLAINSLQSGLWFRLGFAALYEEQWELGAKAYRRYCTLEPDSFEAWNNLARCYCELKQYNRAWRALKEALKVDTSNWRVWDNYMRVSALEKIYAEVIRSYNELLNLKKENHVDMSAIMTVVKGYYAADQTERDSLKKPLLNLIARIASKPSKHASELWIIAADIHSMEGSDDGQMETVWECLLKAHTSTVTSTGWEADEESCKRVILILDRLCDYAKSSSDFKGLLNLVAKPSLSTIKRCHPDSDICDTVTEKLNNM